MVHHAVTLVDLIRPTQRRRNLELDLALSGCGSQRERLGLLALLRPERVRPNSHTAENGDGDVVAPSLPPSFPLFLTCFMFSERGRKRLLISRRGVRVASVPLPPLARPGQFMKIKPIPPLRSELVARENGEAIIANEL